METHPTQAASATAASLPGRAARAAKGRLDLGLALLVVLTVLAVWQSEYFLNHVRVMTPTLHMPSEVRGDARSGGRSSAVLQADDAWRWQCTLREGFAYPHCTFTLKLSGPSGQGVDLREYRLLRLWLQPQGPSKTLRVYLRNANPAYTRPGDLSTQKFNQVELSTDLLRNGQIELDFASFAVANWWVTQKNIPPSLSHVEFSNVVSLEIETGTNAALGDYQFVLKRVELEGQRMPTERWYLLIISLWLAVAFLWLLSRMLRLSGEVRARLQREQELLTANKQLDQRDVKRFMPPSLCGPA